MFLYTGITGDKNVDMVSIAAILVGYIVYRVTRRKNECDDDCND